MYLYTSDHQPCMLFLTNNSTNGNVIGELTEIKTYAKDWWKYIGAGSVWLSSTFFMRKAIYLRDLGCIPIIKISLHWAFNVLENTNCRLCNCTVDFLCASYEKLHWQCQVMQCEASAMHTESVLQICTVTVELTGNIDIIGDTQYCMCVCVCVWARSGRVGLGLPSKYDYWLAEYSPIIPQNSTTTSVYCYALCDVYICIMFNVCLRKMWCIVAAGQTN